MDEEFKKYIEGRIRSSENEIKILHEGNEEITQAWRDLYENIGNYSTILDLIKRMKRLENKMDSYSIGIQNVYNKVLEFIDNKKGL